MSENSASTQPKWHHPLEVMKIHQMKIKKKALQARIKGNNFINTTSTSSQNKIAAFEDVLAAKKRRNPFIIEKEHGKKNKTPLPVPDESNDQTLFKLLHHTSPITPAANSTSFNNILSKINEPEKVAIVKAKGQTWLPVDWTLKSRVRLLSEKPFPWSNKLKISEETSGLVSFTRCLTTEAETTLDTSPNARFHQCCLYWQQPCLPWLTLFPRKAGKVSASHSNTLMNATIRESLHISWTDSLKSLFQLIRTRQCPYFYVCANNFTVLFRAAGVNGFDDIHALITPTTRGLRHLLKQEEIEFTLPLRKKRMSDQGYDTQDSTMMSELGADSENTDSALPDDDEEEQPDEEWLKNMGINGDDIKQINYAQAKIEHKNECQIDNGEQSLILVQGVEVHPLYNFLINCKSATANSGSLAGIPPTLLAPVAFNGGTLQSLNVKQMKVHSDDLDYYCLDLTGPILPTTIHNLFTISPPEHDISVTFASIPSMIPLSKVNYSHSLEKKETQGRSVFGNENLADCGLNSKVLRHFCSVNPKHLSKVECLKYTSEDKTFTWT